jgi:GNAT superfamily N-acetyltransferase
MNQNNQKNINNLISLWKTIGNSFQQYSSMDNINYCYISNSDWPNRIWFEKAVTSEILTRVTQIVHDNPIPLTISHWSDFENALSSTFEHSGFIKKSNQIGMSLNLYQKLNFQNRIHLEKVTNISQAIIWTDSYPQSFGYKISTEILIKTCHLTPYYLIYLDDQPIGTVITHKTENVIGIHGLGIIPGYRKQGFAEEAMIHLINQAIDEGIEFATLQSSEMGRNIYLKMGFSEDFLMTNYGLKMGE